MKELIESIENQIKFNSNVVISKDDANKLLQALTSVKSESVEEVLEQKQITLSEYIKLKHTQEECIGFIDGYDRAMHDFANNSEAMKEGAIGYSKFIDKNFFYIENQANLWISPMDNYSGCAYNNEQLYAEYLTNKEK